MKKILIISLFVLGMIIPNINVKAVDVSNEEQLRNAIAGGGDITLTQNIEVTQPLVIDKDVNIRGRRIMMQGDDTLMTVNDGDVTLDVDLYAGWNSEDYDIVKNQGTALLVNGGNVNFNFSYIYTGKVGVEVNGGNVTGRGIEIYAGEETNTGYSGGQGMIVNGGKVELDNPKIYSGGTVLTVNNGSNVTLTDEYFTINSDEENGIEVNDGSVVNINLEYRAAIFGSKNAIYLNGGSVNLNGFIGLSSSTKGKGIYINKGVNTKIGGDVLKLGKNFVFSYPEVTTPNFSIYVNPDIKELRVTDEKKFMEYLNNNLNLGFCSNSYGEPSSQTEEERKATCSALGVNYDGPIESNELNKCTVVYINGVKQNEPDASCTPVAEDENTENNQGPQIVEVPSTSAYGSIIIIVLGIICVIVSVFVMRRVTKKTN